MTKEEEKEAKKEEEEEVPEDFVDAVNEFYNSADVIFKCFDDIYTDYLQGEDIRAKLKGFLRAKPSIYHLIDDTLSGSSVEMWVDKVGVEKEKMDKIILFKKHFLDLADEIYFVSIEEEFGFINAGVNISSIFSFHEEHDIPIIELKFLSGNKELLCLKYPLTIVYAHTELLQEIVKDCLDTMKDKIISTVDIKMLKKSANDLQKGAKEILDFIEEIEKKERKK